MTTTQPERPDANQLLLTGGKAPESADFGQVPPSAVAGTLLAGPTSYHAREFDKNNPGQGALRYWPDGNPVYGVFLDIDIPGVGIRRLYVEKLRMTTAIQQAMLRANVKRVEAGGHLSVMWTGTEMGAGSLPANTYVATYTPPSGAVPNGNAVLANGGPTLPPAQSGPAQWQQGVAGVTNAYATPAPVAPAPTPPAPTPPAPAPVPAPLPVAPTQVLTETIASAMRNAGISIDGYTIVPG